MLTRRRFLECTALTGLAAGLPGGLAAAPAPITKIIPRTGTAVPVIGMGSWLTFDVGDDPAARAQRAQVLATFFEMGGGMIDSSPMYGSSEAVIGHGLAVLGKPNTLFAATKVWTPGQDHGIRQMAESERLWGVRPFDLLQVHNLLGWEGHLETLTQWKADGRVRHIGITTSHGRRHDEPLAAEKGIAVIVNRPFQRGALIDRLQGRPLPPVAAEIGAANWAQVLLKWIVAHPAVTCAIPATTRVDHMTENMGAARGPLPDGKTRRHIAAYVKSL